MRTVPAAVSRLVDGLVRGAPVTGRVLTVLPTVAYVEMAGPAARPAARPGARTVLALETSIGLGLPIAVRVAAATPPWEAAPGDVVRVGEGEVVLGCLVLRVVRAWQPPVVRARAGAVVGAEVLDALPDPEEITVPDLVGRGPGLTPSGDDVLCGALLTLRALGDTDAHDRLAGEVTEHLHRTSSVSAALLVAATSGHALAVVRDLVHAVADDDAATVRRLVPDVERIGHSSGRDLLRGVAGVLEERRSLARAH